MLRLVAGGSLSLWAYHPFRLQQTTATWCEWSLAFSSFLMCFRSGRCLSVGLLWGFCSAGRILKGCQRGTREGDQRRNCDHNLREKVIEEDFEEDGLECFS